MHPRIKSAFKSILPGVTFLAIFLSAFFRFNGPATGYWDTYIASPTLLMANQKVHFISKEGRELYQYSLTARLPDNLVNKEAYGIASKDQRLGAAILFVPWFVLFHTLGFRLLFAASIFLIAFFVFRTMQFFSQKFVICMFCAIVATGNSYLISLDKLNPNILGMMLISVLVYLILSEKPFWFIAGLVYGVLGGVREMGILFFPAIIYRLCVTSVHKKRDGLLFILGALIAIAPLLYWNHFAFGNIFTHPTQFKGLEGFRPVFEHRFLFWRFNFNGMLNYPFYDRIVRTPYFAFPVFLLLPLILVNSFGIILFSFIFSGAAQFFKQYRREFTFLILWFMPIYLLFSVMENWSELKTSFLLLFLNPLIIFMGYGLEKLLEDKQIKRSILKTAVFSLTLFFAIRLMFYVNFSADPRWYNRFPRVLKKGSISYIGDDLRTRAEEPGEILAQKRGLTQANFLPRFYFPRINIPAVISKVREEIGQKEITVIDFWKYIYEA